MHFLGTILASVIAYLIGSINFSVIIVKTKIKVDVRTLGSKNAGATNATRIIGKKWGLMIVFLDMCKVLISGVIAIGFSFINNDLFNQTSFVIPGLFALIGHCWPMYYKFKGGKAVSCFIGLTLIVNWTYTIIFLICWWTIIFICKKVSLTSLIATFIIVVISWMPYFFGITIFDVSGVVINDFAKAHIIFGLFNYVHNYSNFNGSSYFSGMIETGVIISVAGIILLFKHKENIIRLIKKQEKSFFGNKAKPNSNNELQNYKNPTLTK